MQTKYSIKICRINDIFTARYLARCGINFLGLHAIFGIPDSNTVNEYQKIIFEMNKYYPRTETVLVTRIAEASLLSEVYKIIPTNYVQISSIMNCKEKNKFLKIAKKINMNVEIFNVLSATESTPEDIVKNVVGDFVVIDKEFAGGTGEQIDRNLIKEMLQKLKGKKVLLAGGMGRVDTSKWLKGIKILGVDIMSSMEVGNGNKSKDIYKINEFIKKTNKLKEIELFSHLYDKKLKAKLIKPNSNFENSDAYDCFLIEFKTRKNFELVLRKIHSFSHFVPVGVILNTNNYTEFMKLNLNYEDENIDSLLINANLPINELHIKNIMSLFISENLHPDDIDQIIKHLKNYKSIFINESIFSYFSTLIEAATYLKIPVFKAIS